MSKTKSLYAGLKKSKTTPAANVWFWLKVIVFVAKTKLLTEVFAAMPVPVTESPTLIWPLDTLAIAVVEAVVGKAIEAVPSNGVIKAFDVV